MANRKSTSKLTASSAGRYVSTLTVFGLGTLPVLALTSMSLGQGVFYPTDAGPMDVVAVDVNGDGLVDLVTANAEGESVSLLLNLGAGRFSPPVSFALDYGGTRIRAADIDRDGDPDLVVGLEEYGAEILMNLGGGLFTRAQGIGNTSAPAVGLEVADCDGDDDLDIIVGYGYNGIVLRESVGLYRNDGSGTFGEGEQVALGGWPTKVTSLTSGDFDDDGDTDLAYSAYEDHDSYYTYEDNHVHLVLMFNVDDGSDWEGERHVLPAEPWHYYPLHSLQTVDVDGDSDLDIVTSINGYRNAKHRTIIGVIENGGAGQFALGEILAMFNAEDGPGVSAMQTCDIDGDGDLDQLVVDRDNLDSNVYVILSDDTQNRHVPIGSHPGSPSGGISAADFDGNGLIDLAFTIGYPDHGVVVMMNPYIPERPSLTQSDLRREQIAEFRVSGAEPDETVNFLYSLNGTGNSRGQFQYGGMILDLIEPIILFGTATADDTGTANFEVMIPGHAPLVVVATQAAISRGDGGADSVKSNFITAPIQE